MRTVFRPLLLAALIAAFAQSGAGRAQESFSISGTVWHDVNFDGVRQNNEPGVDQVYVFLEGAGQEAYTNSSGVYRFEGVQPGQYQVQVLTGSYVAAATSPTKVVNGAISVGVDLTSASQAGLDFGVVLASDLLTVGGSTWIDGVPTEGAEVRALIGGVDCTVTTNAITPPDSGPAFALFSVAPAGLIEGCGAPGSVVSFTINGRPAHETIPWTPDGQPLALTAGHPVALYVASINVMGIGADAIEARVNGTPCSASYGTFGGFFLAVYSDEQQAGCGQPGAAVTLVVNGKPAQQTLTWQAGLNEIDLDDYIDESYAQSTPVPTIPTVGPCLADCGSIRPPDTGDAGLR